MHLNNSKNKKRVFILGAGASISHSKEIFPSIDGFFCKALEYEIIKPDEKLNDLSEYIKKAFGLDFYKKRASRKINIEKVFTQLEIEIEKTQSSGYITIKEKLLELIKAILINLGNRVDDDSTDYKKFKNQLRETDTIITFNWDILLDDILGAKRYKKILDKNNEKIESIQYHTFISYLTALGEMTDTRVAVNLPIKEKEWQEGFGFYLKMHGSIDWRYCDNEMCRGYGKGFPVLDSKESYICSECYEPMNILLIPPVLNKQYRKYSLVRKIWNLAAKEIELADSIVIWGYSLPPTDFYSEWLLRNARKSIKALTLINPSVVKGKKEKKINKSFVNHFKNIFKNSLKKDSIRLYENFSDYLNNFNIYKKYGINP